MLIIKPFHFQLTSIIWTGNKTEVNGIQKRLITKVYCFIFHKKKRQSYTGLDWNEMRVSSLNNDRIFTFIHLHLKYNKTAHFKCHKTLIEILTFINRLKNTFHYLSHYFMACLKLDIKT